MHQRGVAGLVAVVVVDALEVVHVDHEEVQRIGAAAFVQRRQQGRAFARQPVLQLAAVGDLGQRIQACGRLQARIALQQLLVGAFELAGALGHGQVEQFHHVALAVDRVPHPLQRQAEQRQAQHDVAGVGQRMPPRRWQHLDLQPPRATELAVAPGRFHHQRVAVRWQVADREVAVRGLRVYPALLQPVDAVAQACGARGGEVDRGHADGEHVVAMVQGDALRVDHVALGLVLAAVAVLAGIEDAQVGEYCARLRATQRQARGIDHVHALGAAEVKQAVRVAVAAAAVVLLVLQAVAAAQALHDARARIQHAQAVVGAQPQPPLRIRQDRVDDVAAEPLAVAVAQRHVALEVDAVQPAGERTHPQHAVVFVQRPHRRVQGAAARAVGLGGTAAAHAPHAAVVAADPQRVFAVAVDPGQGVPVQGCPARIVAHAPIDHAGQAAAGGHP
ncbi:hypothetical protein NB706_002103 [Xanthomonas sacchari]|nr:hypothetical protein [Xanthomonas sacchari]